MRVAAYDCGSNSTRILVCDEQGTTLRREMRITRLGQGVDVTGELDREAIQRCTTALQEFRIMADELGVERSALVATSAVRDAANGSVFLSLAADITGAEVATLSGLEEAELTFRGATAGLTLNVPTVVIDIGGGSTEVATRLGDDFLGFSMQLGCVRITERTLGEGVISSAALLDARRIVASEIERFVASSSQWASLVGKCRLVGVAGTVATLAQLDMGATHYQRDLVHHRSLSREVVGQWLDRLALEEPEARLRHPGMTRGRHDVIVGGLVVLEEMMDFFESAAIVSSENDILDGLAATLVSRESQ